MAIVVDAADTELSDSDVDEIDLADTEMAPKAWSTRRAAVALLAVVAAMAGLVVWQGVQTYAAHQTEAKRALFVQVARQAAVNLTTIDYQQAESDIQRVLDLATGPLYDDFSKRSEPFVQLVMQAQSKSVGTVTEAGLESATDTDAQVLVAVSVQTSNAAAPEQSPRAWRMRIAVQMVDHQVKASKVDFVP